MFLLSAKMIIFKNMFRFSSLKFLFSPLGAAFSVAIHQHSFIAIDATERIVVNQKLIVVTSSGLLVKTYYFPNIVLPATDLLRTRFVPKSYHVRSNALAIEANKERS